MNAGAKLAAYGFVLVALAGAGAAVGNAAGPIDIVSDDAGHDDGGHDDTSSAGSAELPAGGLLVSQDGYTFAAADRTLEADTPQRFRFTIEDTDGHPLHDYDVVHDRELHLIVVSADLATFDHVHPERDEHGTWSVELPAVPAGAYRAYADFQPAGGEPLTLGLDLTVPGAVPAPDALTERRTAAVDGFEVTLEPATTEDGERDGEGRTVTVTVRRDGEVLTTDPYLGAAGHLVAIRDGDLAYLHVHPLDEEPSGPVRFAVEFPSAGIYGLYFDFALDGELHTATFVLEQDQ